MGYKRLLLLVISFFIFSSRVSAGVCDEAHIKQLKALAEQVDVSYEYIDYSDEILNGEDGEYPVDTYSVYINLISDELYLEIDGREYYYSDSSDGVIKLIRNSGNLEVEIRSKRCAGYRLRSIYLSLPKFNTYSYKTECKKLEEYDLDVCNPWYQGPVNDKIFYSKVNKYLVQEKVSIFDKLGYYLKKYSFAVVGSVLVVILITIAVIINRKRSVLE